jgi:hypothetical protein
MYFQHFYIETVAFPSPHDNTDDAPCRVCLDEQLLNYPMDYRGDDMKPFVLWRFRVLATLIYYRLRYSTSVYFSQKLLGVNMHLD